jgi:hypothetical protein
MDLVRRIYLYAMSAVTLGVLAYGIRSLLLVAIHAAGIRDPFFYDDGFGDRNALSLAIALVGVGLPVWAIHWYLVGRSLRGERGHGERNSGLRAFYLSAVLAVFALIGAAAAVDVLRYVIGNAVGAGDVYSQPAGSLASLAIAVIAWGFHAQTRRGDVAAGPLDGDAAWWPRLYRYVVSFLGLLAFLSGTTSLIYSLISAATVAQSPALQLPYTLPLLLVGLGGWASHALASERVAAGDGWHGASERSSRLRLVYFPVVIGVAVWATISTAQTAVVNLLDYAIPGQGGLGIPDLADQFGETNRPLAIASSIAATIPWLVAWWLHRRWGFAASAGDPPRVAVAAALERHATSVVGLAFGAAGAAWLVGFGLDALLGGSRGFNSWQFELQRYFAFAILGLPIWAWNWSRAERDHDVAAQPGVSAVRRTYLLLVIGISIVVSLGSLGAVLYRLLQSLLGASFGNVVSDISTPLGILIVAVIVVAYHGLRLRTDREVSPAAPSIAQMFGERPPATSVADAAPGVASRSLRLTLPPGSDPAATLHALRAALPEGATLEEA